MTSNGQTEKANTGRRQRLAIEANRYESLGDNEQVRSLSSLPTASNVVQPNQELAHKNNVDQEETIDDPESRPKAPLPKRPMPNFTYPDPLDQSRNPTLGDMYPYGKTNKQGDEPATKPAGFAHPFTDQLFSMPVMSRSRLLENVHVMQRRTIEENPPNYLAIGIDIPGMGALDLIPAREARSKDEYFAPPAPLFLTKFSTSLRDFLLWQGVFPLQEEGATFRVYSLESDTPNWYWGKFHGPAVIAGGEAKKLEALAAFKQKLWSSPRVQEVVNNFRKANPQAKLTKTTPTLAHTMVAITESLRILYLEPDTHRSLGRTPDEEKHHYVVVGLPISNHPAEQRALKIAISQIKEIQVGMRTMKPSTLNIGTAQTPTLGKDGLGPPFRSSMKLQRMQRNGEMGREANKPAERTGLPSVRAGVEEEECPEDDAEVAAEEISEAEETTVTTIPMLTTARYIRKALTTPTGVTRRARGGTDEQYRETI
ncbi:uncharacterized protein C8R40DRAFT_1173122 [Lentinula edodes]|uniref:uncharacterized protein n=1 Tax=Lentinula edodes TaxID=5353 RepID=UPI001E8EA829|nr:uncharacterized protein C8R40DRAFT_1173122 [Lentinula edodes]KAH7873059.1 hypothetical protein C8R40DRAFT_1173122 [Lentinula edodes]